MTETRTRGLHIAGLNNEFSPHVENKDNPRCPSCRVLFACAPPPFSDVLCRQCEADYEEAERESQRRAELYGGTTP